MQLAVSTVYLKVEIQIQTSKIRNLGHNTYAIKVNKCQIYICTVFSEVRNKHCGKAVPYFWDKCTSQQEHSILIFLKANSSFTSSINVSLLGNQWAGYVINSLAEVFFKQ